MKIITPLTNRKRTRHLLYNYNQVGAYFITICAQKMQCIFGTIKPCPVNIKPQVTLSKYGQILQVLLNSFNDYYDDKRIVNYIIMPNHLHLILQIEVEDNTKKTTQNATVPMTISTIKRLANQRAGTQLFQRSYHDRIIRNEIEYKKIWNYIDNNPLMWHDDRYYKD